MSRRNGADAADLLLLSPAATVERRKRGGGRDLRGEPPLNPREQMKRGLVFFGQPAFDLIKTNVSPISIKTALPPAGLVGLLAMG